MADAVFANKARILARFARMPAVVQATAEATLKSQVEQLVEAEQRAAPVSELEGHPGELRESIAAYETPGRVASYRVIAGARDSKGRLYGRYVEFGHTAADGHFVPAQPFWFSTYRAWKKAMLAKVRAEVRAALKTL